MTEHGRRRDDDVPALPVPADGPGRDVDDVRALLADLSDLRLGLSADLGLVAAAVEIGAHDVAAQVVQGRRQDLAELSARVADRAPTAAPTGRRSAGRARLRVLLGGRLPAAPALAAAAALVAVLIGVLPDGDRSAHERGRTPAASASDAGRPSTTGPAPGASSAQLQVSRLEDEIRRILATAPADPLSAQDALGRVAARIPSVGDLRQRQDLTALLRHAQRWIAELQETATGPASRRPFLPPAVPLPMPGAVAPTPSSAARSATPAAAPSSATAPSPGSAVPGGPPQGVMSSPAGLPDGGAATGSATGSATAPLDDATSDG